MASIITNISLVLDSFLVGVGAAHITGDPLPTIADPTLDYDSALRNFRAKQKILGQTETATRLFAMTRDAMRFSPHMSGRRTFASLEPVISDTSTVDIIKVVFGEMPIRFMFACPHMPELEAFEIAYLAGEGVRTVKNLTTTFPTFPEPLKHFVHWEPALESIELRGSEAEGYRQVALGACVIHGYFFVLRDEDSPSPIIQEIATLIQNPELIVFDSDSVIPTPSS